MKTQRKGKKFGKQKVAGYSNGKLQLEPKKGFAPFCRRFMNTCKATYTEMLTL